MQTYKRLIINKSHTLKRKYPVNNFSKKDKKLFAKEIKKKIPNSYIYFLNNIEILPSGYIKNISYNLIKDFLKFTSLSRFKLLKKIYLIVMYFKKIFFTKYKQEILKDAIFIHDRHSRNYFHWITDVLPKTCVNQKYIKKSIFYLIPNFKTSFQKDSLKLMGIKKIYELKKNQSVKIENLIYVSELYPSGNPSLDIFIKMRNSIMSNFSFTSKKRKIYISRKKSSRRRMADEIEFEKRLSLCGFEIHCMEDYSLKKQIRICAEAKILVGLNGSGLTNLIWMKPGSKIIDIRPKNDDTLNPFFSISQLLNINYYYYLCSTKSILKNSTHSDYEIDFNDFFLKFKEIL
jgi:hypothetical protein